MPPAIPSLARKKIYQTKASQTTIRKKRDCKNDLRIFFPFFFLCFIFEGQGRCAYGIIMWREGKREEERWSPAEFGGGKAPKNLNAWQKFYFISFGFWLFILLFLFACFFFTLCVWLELIEAEVSDVVCAFWQWEVNAKRSYQPKKKKKRGFKYGCVFAVKQLCGQTWRFGLAQLKVSLLKLNFFCTIAKLF